MRYVKRALLAGAVLVLASCGGQAPAGEVSSGGGAPATTRHGLSTASHAAADQLRLFIGEKLSQSPDETTHEANVAEGRRQLAELRSKNTTDADRNVTLLLALLMAKDNERKRLTFLSRQGTDYSSVQGGIASLYQAREACNAEILGWLDHRPTDRPVLDQGPCLAEAKASAAILGV